MNMGFGKLAAGSNNICISRGQANEELLDKVDTINSCIKNTNAIFNKGSSEIHSHDFTKTFKDESKVRKLKF